MKHTVYVGSTTDEKHPLGVHVVEADDATGDFSVLSAFDAGENPTYMVLSRDGRRLYTATGRPGFGAKGANGGLAAYAVEGVKGEILRPLNCIPTGHTPACHVSLSPDEKTLVWAEYSHATAGFVELTADGALSTVKRMVQHTGDGPNKPRQDKAHAHCALVTPDSKYLLIVDLGIDRVVAYDFANRADGMREVASVSIPTVPPGGGPRHVTFQRNGKILYLIHELGNFVASYRYTGSGFAFIEQRALIADPALNASCKASAVKLSADGRQLFCSNRDTKRLARDTITVFNTDPETGRMEFLAESPVGGCYPRDFTFLPGEKFALVGFEKDGTVGSFAYDRATGRFTCVKKLGGFFMPLFFTVRPA